MELNYLYGTAWKEELTSECVFLALKAGFRGIDTANQRKHYNEPGVGEGLLKAYEALNLQREDLFLQSKYTYPRGQDHRKPYNENDSYSQQVGSSFESSLKNLHTDYLDSLVLHGPFTAMGMTGEDKEVWRAMESLYDEGLVKNLGISNASPSQLREFYSFSRIKPKYAQIRCFAESQWEKEHRDFCQEKGIVFQGFSLLTANRQFIGGDFVQPDGRNIPQMTFVDQYPDTSVMGQLISETGKTPAQIIFKFCLQVGMLPITGTRTFENMKMDLDIFDFELSPDQIEKIENIAFL